MRKNHANPKLIMFALWLLMFSASSQLMIISPILPQLGAELNIPEALRGTLITAYAVMLALFALIIGPISDKIGRRRILMLGSGAMAFALFLHNFAFDYYSLLIVRALAGCAGGMLSGACVAYVGDYFPYEKRGWANGWIATGVAVGLILGIPIGTILAEWFGFRGPFALFSCTMYAAFMLIWLAVPQPDVQRSTGRLTPTIAFKNYINMAAQPQILTIASVYGLMYLGISLYSIYLPSWLNETFGATGYEIASLFFVGGFATILSGPRAGKLSDRIGRKSLIIGACIGLSLTMVFTTALVKAFWISYPLFFLSMLLQGARIGPFQALISEIVPAQQRGSMMSLAIALGQIGMGLGGVISGLTYSKYGYISNTVLGAFSVLLMALIIKLFVTEPSLSTAVVKPEQIPPEQI